MFLHHGQRWGLGSIDRHVKIVPFSPNPVLPITGMGIECIADIEFTKVWINIGISR